MLKNFAELAEKVFFAETIILPKSVYFFAEIGSFADLQITQIKKRTYDIPKCKVTFASGNSKHFIQTQFVVVVVHMLNVMVRHPGCAYPPPFKVIIACYGLLFYYLFAGFWNKAYIKKDASKSKGDSTENKKAQ